ncbi:hypothetical protein [Streptomyces sp. NPDC093598]|uniref:hypothetical protein n=1 Tax=Streptomyces sp. NPDC093598 TaxID=3366046 RepID=UPI003803821D
MGADHGPGHRPARRREARRDGMGVTVTRRPAVGHDPIPDRAVGTAAGRLIGMRGRVHVRAGMAGAAEVAGVA